MQRQFFSADFNNNKRSGDSEGAMEAKRARFSEKPTSSTSQPNKNVTLVCKPLSGYANQIRTVRVTFNEKPLKDQENVHPGTSHHPDSKIHMGEGQLVPVQIGDKTEQVLMLFNSARPIQPSRIRPCCTKGVDLRYGANNMYCETPGCRISAGDRYMEQNTDEQVYCIKCHNEEFVSDEERRENLQSWTEKINLNSDREETRTCSVCEIEFHQCCSLEIWIAPFICPNCPRPQERRMRMTLDEYPRNDIEKFMEDKINGFYQSSLKDQNLEATGSKFSVVTYRNKASVMTKDIVPAEYSEAFCEKYGDSIEYYKRTVLLFQRIGEVDVLVYVMYAQEYPRLDKKQWLVVDYMDSVAYVEPRKMSGHVFGEVIISYFSYMSRFGYINVHLFADPPVQNDDYIFHIHPAFQVYKEADSLIRYYGFVFTKGKKNGVISRIQNFKDTQKPKNQKYKTPTDLIPFHGGLWTRVMEEIEDGLKKDQVEQHVKLMPKKYKEHFDRCVKAKIKINGLNNFFLKLAPHRPKRPDSGELKVHTIIGEREEFLDKCTKENWEFSSLRRAKYSSVGIIGMIFEALE
ncbi:unnamed protein product [Caenorhabditis brenneri]